jgi:steroid delta-isomerase-like uncharacterized protein
MVTSSFKVGVVSTGAKTSIHVLKSVFAALNQKDTSGAVGHFADDFTYNDYALDLEFTDKGRLIEFLQKSRELFPDSEAEVVSTFECGDYAFAEWKLTAMQTVPFGSISYRSQIVLSGSTIVEIRNGNIARWADYYDQLASRRTALASHFKDWIEL